MILPPVTPLPVDANARVSSLPALKITVAPTGARRGKSDHPELPLTSCEIAATARDCQRAGAHELHLHVRDRKGGHSLDPGLYLRAIEAVENAAPGMTIQITTESAGLFDVKSQFATLRDLAPAAASVSVREMRRDPVTAARLYALADRQGTRIQHILYDVDDVNAVLDWIGDQVIPDHMRDVIFVLGRYDPPRRGKPGDIAPFLAASGGEFPDWTICAFGPDEHEAARAAILLGGHVRIGFENNIHAPDGTLADNNASNVHHTAMTARQLGRKLLKSDS